MGDMRHGFVACSINIIGGGIAISFRAFVASDAINRESDVLKEKL